jgi:hypothetical protein
MHVTFPRLPDHERAYAVVERDDGAVYRLYGGPSSTRLPDDIMHLVVERELRIGDGIWGGIASGVSFDTLRAQALASLVQAVACLDHPSDIQIRTLVATQLSVLSDAGAGAGADPGVHLAPAEVAAAAQALQVEAARWARLRVGEQLSYDWPREARAAISAHRARTLKPRIVRPYKKGKGRRPA